MHCHHYDQLRRTGRRGMVWCEECDAWVKCPHPFFALRAIWCGVLCELCAVEMLEDVRSLNSFQISIALILYVASVETLN